MQTALYALAFVSGLLLTVQVGLNAALRSAFGGNPGTAALANFMVGTLGLFAYLLVTRAEWPARAAVLGAPAWAWFGGLLGAFYVASSVVVGPRLGAAALLALTVFGQLVASLVVDNYGWLGFPQHPLTAARFVGVVLLLAGVILIVR
jgi:bacterial/archaeal transporter family-2 protein